MRGTAQAANSSASWPSRSIIAGEISPDLLQRLTLTTDPVEAKLTPEKAKASDLERVSLDEKTFRFAMNEDAMATEKMAEAIRRFTVDTLKLEEIVESKL